MNPEWALVFLAFLICYEIRVTRNVLASKAQEIVDLLHSMRQTGIDSLVEERSERDMQKLRERIERSG